MSDDARLREHARAFAAQWASRRRPRGDGGRLAAGFAAVESFDRLAAETYRLRARASAVASKGALAGALAEAEATLSDAAQDLAGLSAPPLREESAYRAFVRAYRQAWRAHFSLFVFVSFIFCASCLLGWNVGVNEPDYMPIIVSQAMMERIQGHEAWFEELRAHPISGAVEIAVNNMKVAALAFVAGSAFGFGGLFVLAYNGLSFGATLGYCWTHGFHKPLLSFVAAHGPLELTLFVASAFAGLLIGRAFYRRPLLSGLPQRMQAGAREAAILAMGILPWFALAGLFEGCVSPFHIPVASKIALGALLAALFWAWTFRAPRALKPAATSAAAHKAGSRPSSNPRR